MWLTISQTMFWMAKILHTFLNSNFIIICNSNIIISVAKLKFRNEIEIEIAKFSWEIGERSDFGLCPWDWSTRYCTNRRERPSLLDLLSEFGLISDGWLGSISPLEIGPMHLSVEGLRSLRLVIPGIAVSPGVTHSDSRIVFVTGTVVKPQQPPPFQLHLFVCQPVIR